MNSETTIDMKWWSGCDTLCTPQLLEQLNGDVIACHIKNKTFVQFLDKLKVF